MPDVAEAAAAAAIGEEYKEEPPEGLETVAFTQKVH